MMVSKDGMYSMLIGQNELETDTQSADYKPNSQQDLPRFTVRDGPRVQPYKLATAGLALLCIGLLIVIIALCIHFQNSYRLRSELDSIASNHSTVTKALEHLRGEYREALDARHRVEAQQEQLQKKIESLLVEKKDLQSLISMHENSCGKCLPGWKLFKSKCYYFSYDDSKPKKSWSGSREDCITQGADLAVVDSEEKQVKPVLCSKSVSHENHHFYGPGKDVQLAPRRILVGTKRCPCRRYLEVVEWNGADCGGPTDSPYFCSLAGAGREQKCGPVVGPQEPDWGNIDIKYWMDGEPNDTNSEEDCASIYPKSDLLKSWNDAPCNYLLNWICESEIPNP